MGKKNQHNFKKLQKEIKRKKKAEEKLARRQGKRAESVNESNEEEGSD